MSMMTTDAVQAAAAPSPDSSAGPSGPASSAGFSSRILSRDFLASLVVFLVAVPLGLGVALASGAPLIAGLIACAVGGIVAGTLSGAPLQVSGPAAGLTVLVYGTVQKFGWEVTLAVTAAAGLIQLALGSLRISRACLAISPAVVKGMLAGIGVVIALSQLHVLLGGSPQSSAWKNLVELPGQIAGLHGHAALLGVLTLAILFAWPLVPRRIQVIPGPLVAVLAATLISSLAWFDVARVDLPDDLFAVVLPKLPAGEWGAFLAAALSVAIVASVESLLCAVATDKLHSGPRANLDRELMAQGVANAVSGLIGGLPVTGVIVRSSTNIQAGAVTRVSAILHGVWVILAVLLLTAWMERVPLPALAGLLVYVGIKLVNRDHIRELACHREAAIYAATLLGVVFIGLLQGVGIGVALSVVFLLRRLARTKILVEERAGRWHVRIDGTLTFMNVPELDRALARIPRGTRVDIDLAADFMDHAAFEALHSWRLTHEKLGGKVDIDELHEEWYSRAASGAPIVVPDSVGREKVARAMRREHNISRMDDLARGVLHFRRAAAEAFRPLFSRLAAEGQSPKILFITCGDSRIEPCVITATRPGDLFTIRNIGNLVPSCDGGGTGCCSGEDVSVTAALEFTLDVLRIENIVICGHSECGAMKALLEESNLSGQPHLEQWLKLARPTLDRFRQSGPPEEGIAAHDHLSRLNVIQQLEHLRRHPKVRARMAEGTLLLHGWFFDIRNADVYTYDATGGGWTRIDEQTVEALLARHPEPARAEGEAAVVADLSAQPV